MGTNLAWVVSSIDPNLLEPYHHDGEYIGQEQQQESEEDSEAYTSDEQGEHTNKAISVVLEDLERGTSED